MNDSTTQDDYQNTGRSMMIEEHSHLIGNQTSMLDEQLMLNNGATGAT